MEKALRNGLYDYKTSIYLAEFLTILSVCGYESHQKDIGKYCLGFALNFSIFFSVYPTKLFYAKGLSKENKCALGIKSVGIKSVGIKKAEPLSSASKSYLKDYKIYPTTSSSLIAKNARSID
ncbi:hypothetical protein [Pedobacter antarcticus]|uniref:hypothetical protein n=1 Tax=Pedobacter antarcticus TaxID=34086 RepID=UPI0009428D44|nr:hypothetical protein [Pedobacter antarcticus]